MAVCSKCGAENPPDASFCAECGNAMAPPRPPAETSFTAGASSSSVATAPSHPTLAPKAAVDSTLKILVIIGTLFVPLVGIILGLIYMADASPEKKAVGRLWLTIGSIAFVVYMMCFFAGSA